MASLARAAGNVFSGLEDAGAIAGAVAELGMFATVVGVLLAGVEIFTVGVGALFLLPKLGFPLVLL